jgi:dTDP-4-dehydrorhamnose reductase
MLRLAEKGIHPRVVSDQHGCPTYARDLALAIRAILDTIEESEPGIYNFCNSGETTWFDFATAIFESAGSDTKASPITTEEFGAAAPRPGYSVLDTSRFQRVFGIEPRNWKDALEECIARLSDRPANDN